MKRFIITFKDAGNCEITQYRVNADTIGQAFEEALERVSHRQFFKEVDSCHIGEIRNWKGKTS